MMKRRKRLKRPKAEMARIRDAIYAALEADHPMTVRQTFYQLVSAGVIHKTEAQYKSTVIRLLCEMRRSGQVPYDWIADNTRSVYKPTTHLSLSSALERMVRSYRRSLWDAQSEYVEIWLEKEALASVLYEVTCEWDCPLMVTRGYSSLSFPYEAAEVIREQNRPCYLFHFGDYDPSGLDISRHVCASLREMAPEAEIHFERVAVTPDQIREMNLPTRPAKQSDRRAVGFEGGSVEVDAIPPCELRKLAEERIKQHLDLDTLGRTQWEEELERDNLAQLVGLVQNDPTPDSEA